MRIGKWQKIYQNVIPLPETLSTAFGLNDGSQLHLAPIKSQDQHIRDAEIVVSPVPYDSWRSACRLSVRLQHKPKSLSVATKFLREQNINILLTEACATYQERAHWDAICDINLVNGFEKLSSIDRNTYQKELVAFLDHLNAQFLHYISHPDHQEFFLTGTEAFAKFSTLPSLNDAYFNCDFTKGSTVIFRSGGIKLPGKLYDYVQNVLEFPLDTFPQYAIITGNTEQRYLVIWFITDYQNLFVARIDNELQDLLGKGVGVLNQMLEALPHEINLLKISNYVTEKTADIERGRLELLGHWPTLRDHRKEFEEKFRDRISIIEIEDIDGLKKPHALTVSDFINPKDDIPRVFISYSTKIEEAKLESLKNSLREIDCEPILGTEYNLELTGMNGTSSSTVVERAFKLIPTCAAFISLQVIREDFKCGDRYLLSPWIIAEEVYALKENIIFMIRLRDSRVDSPRWNENIEHIDFDSEEDFESALHDLVRRIKEWKNSDPWKTANRRARLNLHKIEKLKIK